MNKPMDYLPTNYIQAAEAASELGADQYDDCVPEGSCIAVFMVALILVIAAASFFAYVY